MTLFIALAAAMVLLALLPVLVPLLRGAGRVAADGSANLTVLADEMRQLEQQLSEGDLTQEEFERERMELERQALQVQQTEHNNQGGASLRANRGVALVVAIALPVVAIGVYRSVGTPAALNPALMQAAAPGGPHESNERAIAALEQRLAAQPDDLQGWVLLARSYSQIGRFGDAAAAYQKALVLDGDNPDLLIESANALAMTHGRDLSGQPEQLIQHALALDPDHLGALTFAGLAAFQRDDRAQALQYWHHLVSLLPEDSEGRQRIQDLIARTEAEEGQAQGSATAAPPRSPTAVATTAITGTVSIAPELADKMQTGDTLFIFARATEGPPMPLAAVRTVAGDWPVAFKLDDSSAMMEGRALSNFESVDIVARVSHQGSATAQAGDLEGVAEQVAVGSQDVAIVIDHVVD